MGVGIVSPITLRFFISWMKRGKSRSPGRQGIIRVNVLHPERLAMDGQGSPYRQAQKNASAHGSRPFLFLCLPCRMIALKAISIPIPKHFPNLLPSFSLRTGLNRFPPRRSPLSLKFHLQTIEFLKMRSPFPYTGWQGQSFLSFRPKGEISTIIPRFLTFVRNDNPGGRGRVAQAVENFA